MMSIMSRKRTTVRVLYQCTVVLVLRRSAKRHRGSKVTDIYPEVTDVYRNGLLHMIRPIKIHLSEL